MHRIQKTIAEFISDRSVPAVGADDTVPAALELMREQGSDCVLVIEEGRAIGIFTERDFLYRVAAERRVVAETRIREVMTEGPETLKASDSIAYAINRMAVRGFRNIPIGDEEGRAIAVLDVRHVVEHISEVFAEVEASQGDAAIDEWTDIGGG